MADQIDTSRNLLIVWDNRADDPHGAGTAATLSGGAWIAVRPLAHLLDPRLMRVAQSASTDPAATRFTVDYGAATDLRVGAIINSNIRPLGTVRRTISEDPGDTERLHDSGERDYSPAVTNPWLLPRADPAFGHGRIPSRERRQYRLPWHDVAPGPVLARYEHWYIADEGNPDGHVWLSRLWTGVGWQTTVPVEFGASWGWEDPTDITATLSGRADADVRPRQRIMDMSIHGLPEIEAMRQYDAIGRLGLSGQLYVAWDPTEVMHRHRRSGLCRMQALNPVELAQQDWVGGAFKFIEEVA
ncbi:hypothetical protein [Roseospira visakhapatnamensis]|uniref:Uncharacterized protein n=1 Tax=Roseospira visakhapatnamensis TaxID=390880 RepID=A0A7W6WBY3_9PROT|nr:hypothetical protein [Roseospira visakhapatnamensis]MBB4268308.1 hypothetical protein [Roseospira visakhapatnamensis]